MAADIPVVLVYEDGLSEAVLRKLLEHTGRPFLIDRLIPCYGFGNIKRNVPIFLNAAKAVVHVVLTDLDQHACAPALIESWGLTHRPEQLLFRVAEREVEAWLLADTHGLSSFLGVPANKMPTAPESLPDPKGTLISIARRSKSHRLRQEMTPAAGSRVSIGPLYNEHLIRFVRDAWSVNDSLLAAPSLARAIHRLANFDTD